MSSSAVEAVARATEVEISSDELRVLLIDGRRISAPLAWFPRLLRATPEQLQDFHFLGDGKGIRWPAVDEDLSVAGLLRGALAPGAQP